MTFWIAAGMLAVPHAPKSVDSPTSRLSKRMTWKPRLASPSNSASGQIVSCAPSPMTNSSAGSALLPVVSYSISMPLALTRATPPPFHRFAKPSHRHECCGECHLRRVIGGPRVICHRRPGAGILDVAAEFLEAEAAVRSAKQIDTAIVLGILDAVEHHPRLFGALGH